MVENGKYQIGIYISGNNPGEFRYTNVTLTKSENTIQCSE
jgi:hypothetical protein